MSEQGDTGGFAADVTRSVTAILPWNRAAVAAALMNWRADTRRGVDALRAVYNTPTLRSDPIIMAALLQAESAMPARMVAAGRSLPVTPEGVRGMNSL